MIEMRMFAFPKETVQPAVSKRNIFPTVASGCERIANMYSNPSPLRGLSLVWSSSLYPGALLSSCMRYPSLSDSNNIGFMVRCMVEEVSCF